MQKKKRKKAYSLKCSKSCVRSAGSKRLACPATSRERKHGRTQNRRFFGRVAAALADSAAETSNIVATSSSLNESRSLSGVGRNSVRSRESFLRESVADSTQTKKKRTDCVDSRAISSVARASESSREATGRRRRNWGHCSSLLRSSRDVPESSGNVP